MDRLTDWWADGWTEGRRGWIQYPPPNPTPPPPHPSSSVETDKAAVTCMRCQRVIIGDNMCFIFSNSTTVRDIENVSLMISISKGIVLTQIMVM